MIALAALTALAAPVVSEPETMWTELDRCAMEAEAQAGVASGSWRQEIPETLRPSDRVAVVVGVPCHRDPAIPSLAYSTRDAERVAQTLEAGGFTVVRLLTVVDRASLAAALDRAGRAVTPDGTLLVYFSGHGVLRDHAGELLRYLVLSDTRLGAIAETGVSLLELDRRIAGVGAAARIVIQDTCFASDTARHAEHNGAGKSLGIAGAPRDGTLKGLSTPEANLALDPGDLRLYASQFFEQAIESPAYRSSVYTHNLLTAFASPAADLDGDGCVGLIEAHEWAAVATEEERSSFQTPQIRADAAPNLVLGCRAGAPQRAVVVPPPDSLLITMRDPEGRTAATRGGPVPPGRYTLDVDRVSTGALGELVTTDLGRLGVKLEAGDWLDVGSEVRRRRPLGGVEAVYGWAPELVERYPASTFGLSGWGMPRDLGAGRPLVGARAAWAPGPGEPDIGVEGARYAAWELLGQFGWQWTLAVPDPDVHVSLGPVVALGGANRRTSGSGAVSDWPWLFDPTVRLHVADRRVVLSLEAGARTIGGGDPSGPGQTASASPMFRIGAGARL